MQDFLVTVAVALESTEFQAQFVRFWRSEIIAEICRIFFDTAAYQS